MKTLIPGDPGDLHCDTCTNRYADRGFVSRTWESARVAGWHIYQGSTWSDGGVGTGDAVTKILCPDCVGTPRSRGPVTVVLQGQMDVFEALNVTVTPVPKERKGKKGREMS